MISLFITLITKTREQFKNEVKISKRIRKKTVQERGKPQKYAILLEKLKDHIIGCSLTRCRLV